MKVYFNNSCKICRAEINLYKKENIKEIDWIDITNNSSAKKETSKNDKELLRRLHVIEDNKVIEGAEAFLYVWKKIPKYKFLYFFLNYQLYLLFLNMDMKSLPIFYILKIKNNLRINLKNILTIDLVKTLRP